MFYSSNQITNKLTCNICKNKLFDPRLVPCGRTFCNECISKSADDNKFNCECEKKSHDIPNEGFPVNLLCGELLNEEPEEVSRGPRAKILKINLDAIKTGINYFEMNIKHCEIIIKEYCRSIKNEIDISAETAIQNVQNEREEMLKKVDAYEQECLMNVKNDNSASLMHEIKNSTKEMELFYQKWKLTFDQYKINEPDIDTAIESSQDFQVFINRYIINLEHCLFGNEKIKFTPNENKQHQIGTLELKNLPCFVDISKQSCVGLRKIGVDPNKILNGLIDMDLFDNNKLFICLMESKDIMRIIMFDLVNKIVEISKEIGINGSPNPQSIRCSIVPKKKILISIIYYDQCHNALNYMLNSNLEIDDIKRIEGSFLDVKINSRNIYFLEDIQIHEKFNNRLITGTKTAIRIYDHDFSPIQYLDPSVYQKLANIKSISVNENTLILQDVLLNLGLVDLKSKCFTKASFIAQQFSLYNECFIITYEQSAKSLWYYCFDGRVVNCQKLDDIIIPTLIKGGMKRVLIFDKNTNDIYF